MSQPHVLEEETITLSDLKQFLDDIQTRDEELSFRAGKTMDHVNHLTLVDQSRKEELVKQIQELNVPRLKDFHIHKIVDVMPGGLKELNLILSGYTLTVNKEYQQKIIEVLQA